MHIEFVCTFYLLTYRNVYIDLKYCVAHNTSFGESLVLGGILIIISSGE